VDYRVLKATDFGLPQKRERIFIVGVNRDRLPGFGEFHWPQPPEGITTRLGDVLEEAVGPQYTLSQRMWDGHQRRRASHRRRGNGFGFGLFTPDSPSANTLTTRYYKDGGEVLIDQSHLGKAPRRLTPRECARLQGFPDSFRIDAVSDMQAYKQFGNTVPVPVVRAVAQALAAHVQRAAGEEAA
jgi:DNA (cytosine-5)-methyltransferase 1